MTTPADIFEHLAQLSDRTPEQRAADARSAAILRWRAENWPHHDEDERLYTEDELRDAIVDRLAQVLDDLPSSSKRARELLRARVMEVAAS